MTAGGGGPSVIGMRRILALALVVGLAAPGCGTRTATIVHATLAATSLLIAASASPEGDCSEDCDQLGPAIERATFGTAAAGFALAALVSYALTPDEKPRLPPPAPLPMGPPGLVPAVY